MIEYNDTAELLKVSETGLKVLQKTPIDVSLYLDFLGTFRIDIDTLQIKQNILGCGRLKYALENPFAHT